MRSGQLTIADRILWQDVSANSDANEDEIWADSGNLDATTMS